MLPLYFFLAGIPGAGAVYWAIGRLAQGFETGEDPADEHGGAAAAERQLFWQVGAWPERIRVSVSASLPPLMALAAIQYDALQAALISLLVAALLVCTATDLMVYRVANAITYPGTGLALFGAFVLPGGDFFGAALASAAAAAIFFALYVVTRGGMGLGDVKLAAFIGAALGLSGAYSALVLGVIAGGFVMLMLLALRVVSRRQGVPYAPFLAIAAIIVALQQGTTFAPL